VDLSCQAAVALASTSIGPWASRNQATAAGVGDPSLQVAQALRLVCWCWVTLSHGNYWKNRVIKVSYRRNSEAYITGMGISFGGSRQVVQ
jgi:hypothetical protein